MAFPDMKVVTEVICKKIYFSCQLKTRLISSTVHVGCGSSNVKPKVLGWPTPGLAVSRPIPNPPLNGGGERRDCLSPNAKIMLLASPNSRLPHGSIVTRKCNGPTSPWSTRLHDRESPPSQVSLITNHKFIIISLCSSFPTGYSLHKLIFVLASLLAPIFLYSFSRSLSLPSLLGISHLQTILRKCYSITFLSYWEICFLKFG